ncbi:hypothetical protein HPP92_026568 [Vanilla planifolia]|uniref:O-methyltransferase C-terminal domain-containing protein n=1 Tax=Vanilla planifolia TaxID=51239 RepID=A0A835PFK7_VANPL|nr:hypothetical protein HPP92_026568 [Vanilla planifolia]
MKQQHGGALHEELDHDAYTYAMQLVSFSVLPMTLRVAVEVGLLNLISASGSHLSAEEITARLETSNSLASPIIERILRLLCSYSILTFSSSTDAQGRSIVRYGHTHIIMNKVMESYPGFHDVDVVVDIGGGLGSTLKMIVERYPHIKGINFDLPHVISQAAHIPGVEHVGGDMFDAIPSGDLILMKLVSGSSSDAFGAPRIPSLDRDVDPIGDFLARWIMFPSPERAREVESSL